MINEKRLLKMRMIGTKHIAVIILMLLVSTSAFGRIQVSAQVDSSDEIYVGESFTYHIIIDGQNKPVKINLKPLAQYNPKLVRNSDASETSIIISNGKRTKKIIKRYVMSYSLTARSVGQFQLPAVKVTLDGKTYKTNAVNVNIQAPATTDKLDLEVTLSQQQCYVGQPITMTVNFYVSNSTKVDNFGFDIPAFTSGDFHIEEPDTPGRNVKEFRLHTGMRVLVNQYRVKRNNESQTLLTFSKILIPKHPGPIQIKPTQVVADVAVARIKPSSRSFFDGLMGPRYKYKKFTDSTEPQTLKVLPLPERDKPKDFYGLVGKYTISASAVPTKVNVLYPITLTIRIGGGKYLKPVKWPQLEQVPEIAENFKIPSQRATPVIENGFKVFTQTIRPSHDKITEIPPIPVSFFDPDKGKYVVARTEPIELEVEPTTLLTGSDLEGLDFTPASREVEAIKKGLSANYEGPDCLINMSFSPLTAAARPGYALLWSLPLATLLLSSLIKFFTHTTDEKIVLKRSRRSRAKAIGQLKKIHSAALQQKQEQLASIMTQYIGERFDKVTASLTADDCHRIIYEATKDHDTADKYKAIIGTCQEARYASTLADVEKAEIKEVIALIGTIEKKTRK